MALLLGHIYFHGLHQADKAEAHYQLVLASTPPDTLRDLAQQGVERCGALADQAASSDPPTGDSSATVDGASIGRAAADTAPASHGPGEARVESAPTLEHDLIRDPFLGTSCAATASNATTASSGTTASTSAPTAQGSATPWLQNVTPLQNEENDMTSVADASALAVEPPVIASGDSEDDHEANDDSRLPLTAASGDGDGDGDTLHNNARIDPDVEQNAAQDVERADVNAITADEAPPPIDEQPMDELPPNQTPTAVEPLDLSPWLLRRSITFNKR